jgi:uncharacterized protein
MHDCAHAPFSHTFEAYYDRVGRARKFLYTLVDEKFQKDFDTLHPNGIGIVPHELFSAAIFLKHYKESFKQLTKDKANFQNLPELVARMITGCTHVPAETVQQQIEDCLIHLINGPAIDVDKLDYILRDTWASGVNNTTIDIHRLLTSLELDQGPNKLEPVFRKSALSVIKSVIDGRNFLFRWIYSHHTVLYYDYILEKSVNILGDIVSPQNNPREFLEALFSEQVFENSVKVGPLSIFLPCDDDIYAWLKLHRYEIPQVSEILRRQPAFVPLWKTQAEFDLIFLKNPKARPKVQNIDLVKEQLREHARLDNIEIIIIPVTPKTLKIEEHDLFVKLLDKVVCFKELTKDRETEPENVSFCYIFIPREYKNKISDCVQILSKMPVS